jgi:hypothetical protein
MTPKQAASTANQAQAGDIAEAQGRSPGAKAALQTQNARALDPKPHLWV